MDKVTTDDADSSQDFLGPDSQTKLQGVTAAVVGLSGGGSHVVQQLAHVGVGRYVLVDFDIIKRSNLNRLVGGTVADVVAKRPKVEIAQRVIKTVNLHAEVLPCCSKWQEAMAVLRGCDVIFGCVNSFRERDELERFARRYLIPYIDLGMDVNPVPSGFGIGGQVVLSSAGGPCLRCLGIISDERIRREAEQYGAAGSRPQVVWSNGVLASLAVGLFVQLICPWHAAPVSTACCEFDGNRHRVETNRLGHAGDLKCRHFRDDELGDQFFSRPG